jgi:phosphopantothenoylcysteine decarboxylase/phosphopantothenate--cysteine ligase
MGNHSSGKMGFAVAEAARDRGATVRLIACSTSVAPPIQVALQQVTTAAELEAAVHAAVVGADAIVMAAAVADYRVASVSDHKLKRTGEDVLLRLVPNSDIIASLKEERLIKIGFAAETEDVVTNAGVKLMRKGLDLIVANDLTSPGSGFGTDTNAVFLIDSSGVEALPLLSKTEVGHRVLDRLVRLFERPKSATE